MSGNRLESSEISTTSLAEEIELVKRQRRNNIILGVALGLFAILLAAFAFYFMTQNGFVPFRDEDIFRSV